MGVSIAFQLKGPSYNMRLRRIKTYIEYKIGTHIVSPPKEISIRDVKCYFLIACDGQLFAFLLNWTQLRHYFRIFMVVNRDIRESAGDSEKS
jgi:hypothetical protein